MQFSSDERAESNITGKKVPTAESAGISKEKFREIISNPIRNRVALYDIVSELESKIDGHNEDRETEELMKSLGFSYKEMDLGQSEEDKIWTDKDILKSFVENTKIYLSGQIGKPFKDYAEALIASVFNEAVDNVKKSEEEIRIIKEVIFSNSPESIRKVQANELVDESKRLALAEEKVRKSLMAYHHFLSNSVSQSSS